MFSIPSGVPEDSVLEDVAETARIARLLSSSVSSDEHGLHIKPSSSLFDEKIPGYLNVKLFSLIVSNPRMRLYFILTMCALIFIFNLIPSSSMQMIGSSRTSENLSYVLHQECLYYKDNLIFLF